jgi:endoglucanase
MNATRLRFLTDLLSQPTAPFREEHVLALTERALQRARVPAFLDPAGNLVIGVDSRAAYRQLLRAPSREPVRLFIAHMDHPGFHGTRWLTPERLAVKWHGGSPVKHLAGNRVWLADATGYLGAGRLLRPRLLPSGHALDTAEVRLHRPLPQPVAATALYGGFGFRAPVWQHGERIYTKAADDLIGVFAIVTLAQELFGRTRRTRPPFLGLLTRGEEVGFVGAIAHLELGWLEARRRPLVAVSLETSRALPNAVVGRGPVVRLGDRRTVFDPDALRVLADVAERVLPGRHQRRVMDGGTCEATAAVSWGLPAIGMSVPLGNYHNEHFTGVSGSARDGSSTRGGPAPEYVHRGDIDGLIKLCRGLLEPGLPWNDPWREQRTQLRRRARRYRTLL